MSASDGVDTQLVQYLSDVLRLQLSAEVQPMAPSQLMTKWQDPSPSRLEPSQLDISRVAPLRVLDAAAERRARRCAVELLGVLGSKASTALPDLVEYASQDALDDAARFEAETTLFEIASKSSSTLTPTILTQLVQQLGSNMQELSRSVLLILAPTRLAHIASLVLTDPEVPASTAALVLRELFWGVSENAQPVFHDMLANGDYAVRWKVLLVLQRLGWEFSALRPVLDSIVVGSEAIAVSNSPSLAVPTAAEVAGALIQRSSVGCSRLSAELLDPFLAAVSRSGVVGDAATVRLRCAAELGQLSPKKLQGLVESSDTLVRQRAAQIIPASSDVSRAKWLIKLASDTDVRVLSSLLDSLTVGRLKVILEGREALLTLSRTLAAMNPNEQRAEVVMRAFERLVQFGPGTRQKDWRPVFSKLLNTVAAERQMQPLAEKELGIIASAARALGGQALELPALLMKSKSTPERLLGVQLLDAVRPLRSGGFSRSAVLLVDPEPAVREYVLAGFVKNPERTRDELKYPPATGATTLRGAMAALSVRDVKQTALARTAAEWLQEVSCREFLLVLSAPLMHAPQTRAVVQTRLLPCLKQSPTVSEAAVDALGVDAELRREVVSGLLDESLDQAIIPAVLLRGERWHLTPSEAAELLRRALRTLPVSQAVALLPVAVRPAASEWGAQRELEDLAERAGIDTADGCAALWAASTVAQGRYAWDKWFKAEIDRDDKPFFTCAALGDSDVAQKELTALLAKAPVRRQATLLRRLAAVPVLRSTEELRSMVQQTLQAPNDEIRCQSVRVALRIDSDFEQTRAATRRSLYG
ncbi:MAG: hypothetical protein EBZ48_02660, partial [Proteobacteria bacterium]|nr:hypothetical protein [Pseudomonadota bacterium]